jgi:ABC-2 type transport system ATP-binding protein
MLDLIARIGSDFGISVVVASHLLGEIEQICDHLIAIDGGRLLRAATISSFTQASQVLAIEVDEGVELLADELARRGLDPVRHERELLVLIASDATFDAVRDAVADLRLPLNRMEQRRHRVEELFRDPEGGDLTGGATMTTRGADDGR